MPDRSRKPKRPADLIKLAAGGLTFFPHAQSDVLGFSMLERTRKPRRPRDLNQLAVSIAHIATKKEIQAALDEGKNPAAVALGRLGGQKGGKARARKLSAKQRSEIARTAARARWDKNG